MIDNEDIAPLIPHQRKGRDGNKFTDDDADTIGTITSIQQQIENNIDKRDHNYLTLKPYLFGEGNKSLKDVAEVQTIAENMLEHTNTNMNMNVVIYFIVYAELL